MALTLPNSFNNSNIHQNWLFQLYYDSESNFTGVAFNDSTVDSVFYHGVVSNSPSIRESIDLEKSTSKKSNISLTVANFKYQGSIFSKELYGTRKYLNRIVKVYIQPNFASSLSDCLLIYTGKIDSISHGFDKITINIQSKSPWDDVEIPQLKTNKHNYFPIAYGDYTPNTNTIVTSMSSSIDDFRLRKTMYPIPVDQIRGTDVYALSGEWSQSSNAYPHFYEKSIDKFLPLANHASTFSTVDTANESYKSGYAVKFHKNLLKATMFKPLERVSSGGDWASNNNAFDEESLNTSTSTQLFTEVDVYLDDDTDDIKFAMPQLTGVPSALAVYPVVSGSSRFTRTNGSYGEVRLEIINFTYNSEDILGYFEHKSSNDGQTNQTIKSTLGGNVDVSSANMIGSNGDISTEWKNSSDGWGNDLIIRLKQETHSGVIGGNYDITLNLHDVIIQATTKLDYSVTTTSGKSEASTFLDNLEYVYSGGDGLTDNGWNSNSAITEIHEAHRDLIHRFTSYTNSNTPINWSSGTNINSAKDWKIRKWVNTPTLLSNVLDELQFEGGFIFRFDSQNQGQYIYIPDSITVNHTISQEDMENVDVSITSMDKVITSMDIEYEKHPALNEYVSKVSASNSTAISDLLVGTNENKKTFKLNALVSEPATTPSSNPNDDFYTYYNNILGSQKLIVKSNIINPKYYGIDIGDFVKFDNMPFEPFGFSWSDKTFMVISVDRKLGSLNVIFREVKHG
tara:strand:+ start:2838 stop:5051 length:2214 start_codon:yes stop_codon:yes gene_type:complete